MRADLDAQLCTKYSSIFEDRNASMRDTCMCWGFEVGDGWYTLIDSLCGSIQWAVEKNDHYPVMATQVKEKFGALRFYYSGGDDYIDGLIDMAEKMSTSICEKCGNPGKVTGTGWLKTLCPECEETA